MSFNFCLKTPKIDDDEIEKKEEEKLPRFARKEQRRAERETKKNKKEQKKKTKNISLSLSHLSADLIALFFLPRVLITQRAYTRRERMTTILTTTTKNNEREESDATNKIMIFVKLLPEPNNEEHKNLTRFQVRDSRSKYLGKTCVFRDVEKNKETISELKRKVERETGEKVETLRRGFAFGVVIVVCVLVFRLRLVFCARV